MTPDEDTPTDEPGPTDDADDPAGEREGEGEGDLPDEVVEAAERLTRLARRAVDEGEAAAYRDDRDDRLAEYGFLARVRDADDTLVLYPEEWVTGDGTARVARIDDTGRAVERRLSGAGDPDDWTEIEDHNAELVDRVADDHGAVHAANARAFADFMGNHYARRVEDAGADEVSEFLTEYYPRNAWPSKEQREVVETSIRHLFAAADARFPSGRGG